MTTTPYLVPTTGIPEEPQKFEYPLILKEDNDLSVMISKEELNKIQTLNELIEQVSHLMT